MSYFTYPQMELRFIVSSLKIVEEYVSFPKEPTVIFQE